MSFLGVLVGLAITEAVFWFRDDGGFPHVNFYTTDDELGVRLEPGAEMRLAFPGNPTTEISVNSQGYRGAEWPAASDNEILIVGDSQVFGLGVNDAETAAAQLAEITGRTVINGGVPTYGPLEYTAVVGELIEQRHPKTVVYVLNLANDWFERDFPNLERHVVWDGWAVRPETAPESITNFPGRRFLFQKSHAFYAWRKLQYNLSESEPETVGTDRVTDDRHWSDLVHLSGETNESHQQSQTGFRERVRDRRTRLAQLEASINETELAIDDVIQPELFTNTQWTPERELQFEAARGNPGDIVSNADIEEGTSIFLTASVIRQAVRQRRRMLQTYASLGDVPELVEDRGRLETEREEMRAAALSPARVPSVLLERLREVKALCDENGAELVVVGLPLDVLVSSDEWEKYDAEPVDMSDAQVLLGDLVASAEGLGARAIDLTEALRAVEPGAFLHGDIHMTAKGQRAVAEALAQKLDETTPLRHPDPGLPVGRTRLPTADQWMRTPEAIVRGSSAAKCETIRFHEWLRVTCVRDRRNQPTGVTPLSGGRGDVLTLSTQFATDYIAPMFEGDELTADFHWTTRSRRLVVRWPEGGEPEMFFEAERPSEQEELQVTENAQRLCECHMEVVGERTCTVRDGWPTDDCSTNCTHAYGSSDEQCFLDHPDSCVRLLRCVQGDPADLPNCGEGSANAGGSGQCFALCDENHPCEEGTCTPWQGASVCQP